MKIRNNKKNIEISSPHISKVSYNGEDVFLNGDDVFLNENFEELFYIEDGWEEVDDEIDFVVKWRKIERDKDGFATNECLDEMFSSIPIAIRTKDNDYYVIGETDDLVGWRGDIEIHPFNTHWMKLPKFEEE